VKARELAGTATAADKMLTEGMLDEFSRMNEHPSDHRRLSPPQA